MEHFEKRKASGVTWRAISIALILIPPNVFWIWEVEGMWHSGHPTTISLFWNVVLNLFILILLNLIAKQFAPRHALTQGEMITIYAMLSIASGLVGHDSLALTVPALPHAFWFARPENEWAELFHNYIPQHLVVSDNEILRGFYEGETPFREFYSARILLAWLGPTLWWTGLIMALGMIMISLNVIVRRQWTEHEKLAYPIIQLPMAITEGGGTSKFFSSRILWIGFIIAGVLDIWHGLHHFFPVLPDISVRHNARNWGTFFTEKPWNAIGWLPVPLYPFVIGLGFLLPLDLSFSIWFFFLFKKAQYVFGSIMGFRALPAFPYTSEQSIGAWMAIFVSALLVTRRHLVKVAKTVIGLDGGIDDSDEPIRYRTAVILISLSSIFIVWFGFKAGMTLGIILPFFAFFFAISIAITRVRAELGPPAHEMAGMVNAQQFLVNVLGTRRIGPNNLGVFPLFWFFQGRGYREHIMPHQLEGFKMAERARMNTKKLVLAMALAVAVGSVASFWAIISEMYRLGGAVTGAGGGIGPSVGHIGQFNWLANLFVYPRKTNVPATSFMTGGMLFTFLLMAMRMRFMWWPFHPAGYAISMTFGTEYFWSCLVISTLVKWLILKYGGASMHRKATIFFFGVILGEFCIGAFWSAMSVILRHPIYDFAPG